MLIQFYDIIFTSNTSNGSKPVKYNRTSEIFGKIYIASEFLTRFGKRDTRALYQTSSTCQSHLQLHYRVLLPRYS